MEQMVQTLRLLRWGVVVLMVLRMVGKALECTLLLGGGLQEQGTIDGILTNADPREAEQWQQDGHPVTHKVVQWLTDNQASPQDVLALPDGGTTRTFLIQGLRNPGELGHCIVYYCEERRDLSGLYQQQG